MRNLKIGSSIAFALVLILFLPFAALASGSASETSTEATDLPDVTLPDGGLGTIEEGVEQATEAAVERQRDKILSQAFEALAETETALQALQKGDAEAALDALAVVTGKLELITARRPELALAPVDLSVEVRDVLVDRESIEELVDTAEEHIEKGRIQEAREILADLGSEIALVVHNIPLETYPDAIKAITPLIDAGRLQEAEALLRETLSTLVLTESVIPLPLLRAELFLEEAQSIFRAENRTAAEAARLPELIEAAREELEMAEVLGYGSDKVHEELRSELAGVEEQVLGGVHEEGLFAEILDEVGELRQSLSG